MLTRLRLKNWRSFKDETIDFTTPITVLIGANSSGKTNIVDALYFLKRMIKENSPQSTYYNTVGIQPIGTLRDEPTLFELLYQSIEEHATVNYAFSIETNNKDPHFGEKIYDSGTNVIAEGRDGKGRLADGITIQDESKRLLLPVLSVVSGIKFRNIHEDISRGTHFQELLTFMQGRWQLISEFIEPPIQTGAYDVSSNFEIDRKTTNVLNMLAFMKHQESEIYRQFRDDLSWLLQHVQGVDVESDAGDVKLVVTENNHIAPTISSGTRRLVAILAAYYALDMRDAELPGLVVIEEPDTALNPGLLQKLVEQLRNYTEREDRPRQFILTTHNPSFLNYFKPEEVRVVERDENGYSRVHQIPEYIEEIWLDKYGLGEVWKTNSFGGLPE